MKEKAKMFIFGFIFGMLLIQNLHSGWYILAVIVAIVAGLTLFIED